MIKTVQVTLGSVERAKDFVNDMEKVEGEAVLLAGRYAINAKSIMGILSLDLSKILTLKFEDWREEYHPMVKKYM